MAELVCPYCGSKTAFTPAPIRGRGINWDESDSRFTKYATVSIPAVLEADDSRPHLAIIRCQGEKCGLLFVASKEWGTWGDWQSAWPLVKRPVSEDIPLPVRQAFEEAVLSLAVRAYGGCLTMCRTALIRLQREQGVSNLRELRDSGKISQQMYEQADEVRLWSNMVGHEDFDQGALNEQTCEELVDYIESLLNVLYVQPARLRRHREQRKQAKSK